MSKKQIQQALTIPGVDTLDPEIEVQTPAIEVHEPDIETPAAPVTAVQASAIVTRIEPDVRKFWPDGKPMPEYHIKRQIMPCPKCKRLRMDDGNQATVCASSGDMTVFYKCRACDHRWKMPVKDSE